MKEIYKDIADNADNGKKYHRVIKGIIDGDKMDVYSVLETFGIRDASVQHAIKKLLCSGTRGKAGKIQDLKEAVTAIVRGIQMIENEACESGISTSPDRTELDKSEDYEQFNKGKMFDEGIVKFRRPKSIIAEALKERVVSGMPKNPVSTVEEAEEVAKEIGLTKGDVDMEARWAKEVAEVESKIEFLRKYMSLSFTKKEGYSFNGTSTTANGPVPKESNDIKPELPTMINDEDVTKEAQEDIDIDIPHTLYTNKGHIPYKMKSGKKVVTIKPKIAYGRFFGDEMVPYKIGMTPPGYNVTIRDWYENGTFYIYENEHKYCKEMCVE